MGAGTRCGKKDDHSIVPISGGYSSGLRDAAVYTTIRGTIIASFKYDCWRNPPANFFLQPTLPENARVVRFQGRPNNLEAVEPQYLEDLAEKKHALRLGEEALDGPDRG